jgi:hypothetical protein
LFCDKNLKPTKNAKKLLTIALYGGIISKSLVRANQISKNLEKIFQKSLEKGIDKAEEMWYNSQAVAQEGTAKRMVIEN